MGVNNSNNMEDMYFAIEINSQICPLVEPCVASEVKVHLWSVRSLLICNIAYLEET